jgi:hypothetical protein
VAAVRRRAVPAVAVVLLGTACSAAPTYTYSRAGAAEAEISRDIFECAKEVNEIRNDLVVGPLWYVAAAKSKARQQPAKLMNFCMEGKGYVVEER